MKKNLGRKMREVLISGFIIMLGFMSCLEGDKSSNTTVKIDAEKEGSTNEVEPLLHTLDIVSQIDTEQKYTHSSGQEILIQNSFPKGGFLADSSIPGYYDPSGTRFGFGIFWSRVFNKSDEPIRLNLTLPADSIPTPDSADSYYKLFITPDEMTKDQLPLFSYGVTGLQSFLDSSFHKPTALNTIIEPHDECIFSVVMISHKLEHGAVRSGLILKEEKLFYRKSVHPYETRLIPCGEIVFKK